jgi:L-fuculose-phosphate aldolase
VIGDEAALREAIVAQCRSMSAEGLSPGTSGNISVRVGDAMLITPSATPYDRMTPPMIARMPLDGTGDRSEGPVPPSTEWRFHRAILRSRRDVHAVVHTHSTFATVLSIARRGIPACHYMIAAFGGPDVRCADYATFGTEDLSRNALAALDGRNGCLLANHGAIAVGPTLERAMRLALELETLAKHYFHALQLGAPVILDDSEIARVMKAFEAYGA